MATLTMPSPSNIEPSPFSFYNDSASSPTDSNGSKPKDFLPSTAAHSYNLNPPQSPHSQNIQPSPVDSNGTASTDTTEIDEAPQDPSQAKSPRSPVSPKAHSISPISPGSHLGKIDTTVTENQDPDEETNPQSVIHAPSQFRHFDNAFTPVKKPSISSSSGKSNRTARSRSPQTDGITPPSRNDTSTSPLQTDLPNTHLVDRSTPRAQTIQEAEDEWQQSRRQSTTLEDIPETGDLDHTVSNDATTVGNEETRVLAEADKEHQVQVESLKTALSECWTLCNTLATLSSNHRTHIFAYRGQSQVQESAWRSCWRLCQYLYENRNEDHAELILPTLEMCREFCQALFDARLKGDDIADSVLRVSFELNNHLYNTHDRNLPSAFQERTLDFYLTLCHRLMKQRTSLPPETDALLRACWTLAEMLFSLRQNKREGRADDEELLGSAVQSCWDLCDLFREGWTQVRPGPDRATPRANQTEFSPISNSIRSDSIIDNRYSPSLTRSSSMHSYGEPKPFPPETPTTIFDDVNDSPMGADDSQVPNILVLGPEQAGAGGARRQRQRWTDSACTLSGFTESSQRTSSTTTAPGQTSATAANLTRIRILLLRAALKAGFTLRAGSPHGSASSASASGAMTSPKTLQQQNESLIAFVKALPATAFGASSWQTSLVEKYRRFVAGWPAIIRSSVSARAICSGDGSVLDAHTDEVQVAANLVVAASAQTRTNTSEIEAAVQWMMRKESNAWLGDLFRVAFVGQGQDVGTGSVVVG